MLQIDPDKVCFIIIKAREFDAKEEPMEDDYGSNAADEGMREVLEDLPDDATYEELRTFLEGLNQDEYIDLLALTYVGRGDFTAKEWAGAVTEAKSSLDRKVVDYLLGIPLLGDYLEEGLTALGYSCADMEKEHL
ncbi:MAG: DUF3775 domain-containing protein [Alphaproteobacteria bacterium]